MSYPATRFVSARDTVAAILAYLTADAGGPNEIAVRLGVSAAHLTAGVALQTAFLAVYVLYADPATRTRVVDAQMLVVWRSLDVWIREVQQIAKHSTESTVEDATNMRYNPNVGRGGRIEKPNRTMAWTFISGGTGYQIVESNLTTTEGVNQAGTPHGWRIEVDVARLAQDVDATEADFHVAEIIGHARVQLDYEPEDKGKLAHIRGRYLNARGETGPWSEVIVIPIT